MAVALASQRYVWRNGRRISGLLTAFNPKRTAVAVDTTGLGDDWRSYVKVGVREGDWSCSGFHSGDVEAAFRATGDRMSWSDGKVSGSPAHHAEDAILLESERTHEIRNVIGGSWSGRFNSQPWDTGWLMGRATVAARAASARPRTSAGAGETISLPVLDLGAAAAASEEWRIVVHVLSIDGAGDDMVLAVGDSANATTGLDTLATLQDGALALSVTLETNGTVSAAPACYVSPAITVPARRRYLACWLDLTPQGSGTGGCVADVLAFRV